MSEPLSLSEAIKKSLYEFSPAQQKRRAEKERRTALKWIKKYVRLVLKNLGKDKRASGIFATMLPKPQGWYVGSNETGQRLEKWGVEPFFREPVVWLWCLWKWWPSLTGMHAIPGIPEWPGINNLFLLGMEQHIRLRMYQDPGGTVDYLCRALNDLKAKLLAEP